MCIDNVIVHVYVYMYNFIQEYKLYCETLWYPGTGQYTSMTWYVNIDKFKKTLALIKIYQLKVHVQRIRT